jgi:hypothetical protein
MYIVFHKNVNTLYSLPRQTTDVESDYELYQNAEWLSGEIPKF